MGANDPRGVGSLDPRDLLGRIYVGDHINIATYKTYKPWASRFHRRRYLSFPIISLWELMTPGASPIWTRGAWLAGFM